MYVCIFNASSKVREATKESAQTCSMVLYVFGMYVCVHVCMYVGIFMYVGKREKEQDNKSIASIHLQYSPSHHMANRGRAKKPNGKKAQNLVSCHVMKKWASYLTGGVLGRRLPLAKRGQEAYWSFTWAPTLLRWGPPAQLVECRYVCMYVYMYVCMYVF